MSRPLAFALVLTAGLAGCGNPMNLTYDFGRAYYSALQTQADLSRPGVQAAQHRLSGLEGTEIRLRAFETSTDMEDESTTFNAGR
jgi:hypothetical protein